MLLGKIQEDLKQAMLSRDRVKTSTLRLLLSELNYAKIQKSAELSDSDILAVIQKEVKKRKEGAEGFRKGNREDAAQKEDDEAKILENYLPAQISDEELTKIVEDIINNTGASSIQDMGRVIGTVREKVGLGAEGARVSNLVRQKLQNG